MRLSIRGFMLASGIVAAACMLLATWAWVFAMGPAQFEFLARFYKGYSVTWLGGLIGAAYAFIDGAAAGAAFAWLYNRFGG